MCLVGNGRVDVFFGWEECFFVKVDILGFSGNW